MRILHVLSGLHAAGIEALALQLADALACPGRQARRSAAADRATAAWRSRELGLDCLKAG